MSSFKRGPIVVSTRYSLILGRDRRDGSLKPLFPWSLSSMSGLHCLVAPSLILLLRWARLARAGGGVLPLLAGETAVSFARCPACSFPSMPWYAGTYLTVMHFPAPPATQQA